MIGRDEILRLNTRSEAEAEEFFSKCKVFSYTSSSFRNLRNDGDDGCTKLLVVAAVTDTSPHGEESVRQSSSQRGGRPHPTGVVVVVFVLPPASSSPRKTVPRRHLLPSPLPPGISLSSRFLLPSAAGGGRRLTKSYLILRLLWYGGP